MSPETITELIEILNYLEPDISVGSEDICYVNQILKQYHFLQKFQQQIKRRRLFKC